MTTGISDDDLRAMEARCEAASLGWIESAWIEGDGFDYAKSNSGHYSGAPCPDVATAEQAQADCQFAVHSRTDLPRLIGEVRRLKECLRRLNEACDIFEKNSANAAELYDACHQARRFIENLRVPQTIADAALQVMKGAPVLERLQKLTGGAT